ncbi:hypothetical protein PsorP6_017037 [Peronosclerospora sorghi]|uniref:Uncharacterized protein n=1 Tax=Peronosclerospora sorghi TaxID=230839 RepID=A0ACC0WG31_9STRA|nr:hypothetical protein PsorP6_017037 [Peronosclerospora sorghi]
MQQKTWKHRHCFVLVDFGSVTLATAPLVGPSLLSLRADKLLEDHVEIFLSKHPNLSKEDREKHELHATMAYSYSPDEIHAVFQGYGIKATGTGADLSFPIPFNLMFKCSIGLEGGMVGYLRHKTAQGIFLNFRRLLEYNAGKVPFGCVQIAEIEFFVNPKDKSHSKFSSVKDLKLPLLTRTNQLTHGKAVQITCSDAVEQGIVANESLAYYLVRTYKFCEAIGIDLERLRFRQHLKTEMAHYAADCWYLEIKLSSGWVECAGHADRSCYDLSVHAKKSKVEMVGTHKFDKPEKRQNVEIKPNKGKMGRTFKSDVAVILEALDSLKDDVVRAQAFEDELTDKGEATLGPLCDDKEFKLERDMVAIKVVEKMVSEQKFVPSLIEPYFGIGRLLTAIFEHNFSTRGGGTKSAASSTTRSLTTSPRSSRRCLWRRLSNARWTRQASLSGADELGIPFGVTINFDTVEDRQVTLRGRDSTAQVRIPIDAIGSEVRKLVHGLATWDETLELYPNVNVTAE